MRQVTGGPLQRLLASSGERNSSLHHRASENTVTAIEYMNPVAEQDIYNAE